MDCTHCDTALPLRARFCPSCGTQVRLLEDPPFEEPLAKTADGGHELNRGTPPAPQDHEALKARLIDCYVNFSMSRELSGWLQELELPPTGTMEEKLARLRQYASSLVLPAESLPRQAIWYLNQYEENILAEICQELGIDHIGTKERLLTRIYHAVGIREGWLQPLSEEARQVITKTFLPILRAVDRNGGYDLDRWDELEDVLGMDYANQPGAQTHRNAFMAVLIPGLLQEAHAVLLQSELNHRAGTDS
jgi:hypothetical protein